MASDPVLLVGKLPKASLEHAHRTSVYLASGDEVLAEYPALEGEIRIPVDRGALAEARNLGVVVGPKGLAKSLAGVPDLQRVPVDPGQLSKRGAELRLPLEKVKLNPETFERWWGWCKWYCVSGQIVGPDGCPAPFAEVTVYSVDFALTRTPRATVLADENGNFTACFNWCECFFCCWPCWPHWWWCWPWWWEWDILHVLERIEEVVPRIPVGPGPVEKLRLPLSRPDGKALARGEAFCSQRRLEERFAPDEARTALIKRKLSSESIRRVFPWWWWCCDDPNICFSATQGGNTILDEDPATDTRWCFAEGQSVVLVASGQVFTTC